MLPAKLALEDGTIYAGRSFGAAGETFGEVVFNTSMTGYQEVLTDPSYKGQIVTMTYPLIGNYGINAEDQESQKPQVDGFIVRELSRSPSNFRSEKSLDEYLRENKIMGLEGIDTRALVRRIRVRGAMTGVLSTIDLDESALSKEALAFSLNGSDLNYDGRLVNRPKNCRRRRRGRVLSRWQPGPVDGQAESRRVPRRA
jgi:carbamoyl-phosphate synthase small subunit